MFVDGIPEHYRLWWGREGGCEENFAGVHVGICMLSFGFIWKLDTRQIHWFLIVFLSTLAIWGQFFSPIFNHTHLYWPRPDQIWWWGWWFAATAACHPWSATRCWSVFGVDRTNWLFDTGFARLSQQLWILIWDMFDCGIFAKLCPETHHLQIGMSVNDEEIDRVDLSWGSSGRDKLSWFGTR